MHPLKRNTHTPLWFAGKMEVMGSVPVAADVEGVVFDSVHYDPALRLVLVAAHALSADTSSSIGALPSALLGVLIAIR